MSPAGPASRSRLVSPTNKRIASVPARDIAWMKPGAESRGKRMNKHVAARPTGMATTIAATDLQPPTFGVAKSTRAAKRAIKRAPARRPDHCARSSWTRNARATATRASVSSMLASNAGTTASATAMTRSPVGRSGKFRKTSHPENAVPARSPSVIPRLRIPRSSMGGPARLIGMRGRARLGARAADSRRGSRSARSGRGCSRPGAPSPRPRASPCAAP